MRKSKMDEGSKMVIENKDEKHVFHFHEHTHGFKT